MKISIFGYFITLISCTRYITPPVTGQNNIGYIYRPFHKDSSNSKINLSLGYGTSTSPDGYLEHRMGTFDISRGHTFKNFNFGYGVFGFAGKSSYSDEFTETSSNTLTTNKFSSTFNNIGVRTSIGYHIVSASGKTNYRIINWENAFSVENGKYLDYRKNILTGNFEVPMRTTVYVSMLKNIYTTGFSSEIFRNNAFGSQNIQASLRVFMGGTIDLNDSLISTKNQENNAEWGGFCFITSYFLKYEKFYFSTEIGTDLNLGSKFSLGYSF